LPFPFTLEEVPFFVFVFVFVFLFLFCAVPAVPAVMWKFRNHKVLIGPI
jgi:hypothetical protein